MAESVQKVSPAQWRVLALLTISVWINYVDRANLSVAAPQLRSELSLTAADLGILLSAFFWTYAAVIACVVSVWRLAYSTKGLAFPDSGSDSVVGALLSWYGFTTGAEEQTSAPAFGPAPLLSLRSPCTVRQNVLK